MNQEVYINVKNCSLDGVDAIKRVQSIRHFFTKKEKYDNSVIHILKNISFSCKPGDRLALVGSNGSGKSSILKLLAGIYPHKSGIVDIKGSVTSIIEMGLGMESEFTGRDNIKILMLYNNLLSKYNKELEDKVVEFSGLGNKIDQPLKTYSSGMLARLAFSTSIFHNPEILLLDEVFATGDDYFVKKSLAFLQEKINIVPITVLVSHHEHVIKGFCNRAILIDNGEIVQEGSTDEIMKLYNKGGKNG